MKLKRIAISLCTLIVFWVCANLILNIGNTVGYHVDTALKFVGIEQKNDASSADLKDLQEATVERVVDGDTFNARINGSVYTVRLIGVDTPESVHPDTSRNTQAGIDASNHTKEVLTEGRIVYLQKDTSERDIHNRLLRYVWLEMPNDLESTDEIQTKMYNAQLISEGWADPMTIKPDTKYAHIFESL